MNLTRLRAAENPPEPVCFRRSAIRASSSASQLDVGSLVIVCPSSEYEMTGDPDNKADSTLSLIDSYSASLSDAERAMLVCCVSSGRVDMLLFQTSGTHITGERSCKEHRASVGIANHVVGELDLSGM